MARLGHPAGVVTASFAAVPGTSIRGSSARPSASGTPPTAWTTSLGSVSGGRLPLDRLERVEARLEKVETRLTSIESDLTAVRHNLDDLREKVENVVGFRKEIDHALGRIAAIEKHLGINKKIAA
jgi:tetrahydromethanopterin S-methyltransferase subunit G